MAANKKRISQISKETGVQNRVLVEKAQEIGLLVKSHSSSVGPGEERRLLEALNVNGAIKAEQGTAGYLEQASNAKFTIDGLKLESASNTIDNAIPDVTFTLKDKTEENKPQSNLKF